MGQDRSGRVSGADSEVLAKVADRLPQVRAADSPLVFWGGMTGAVLAGLLVFNGLNTSRGAEAQTPPAPA
ncbi:MAG: hypothetical protein IM619_03380, partial [Phenylobacterium sp.]|nr:hypothetical protein [Phenylobacterium sp.]